MKKFYCLISVFAVLTLGACQNEDDFVSLEQKLSEVEVEATLENGTNSRTSLNEGKVYWEENDALSVFLGNDTKQQATIIKETMEDTYAQFKISAGSDVILGGGTEDNENYFANVAYYPYGDNVTVAKDGDNYIVSAVFPAEQSFKDGSFGTNVYPMVAVSDGLNFGFRNVAGMIHIPLKGTATITKVTVESQNHKLAGNYQVTASADAVPAMEMASDATATNKITLDCGTGVTLNENTALGFDFVLPVGTYEGGDLTFTFYDSNGTSMEFVAANDDKVERSKRTVFSEKLYRNDLGYEKVGENVYNVWSAKGLLFFSEKQQKGVTLNITDDIDFGNAEFKAIPVGRSASLTINGNGYTISNVKVVSGNDDNTTGQASMFYTYGGSTLSISNLKFDNIQVTADDNDSGYAAAVVGYAEGAVTMDDVDVTNATITGAKSSGMLVGHLAANGSLIAKNCDVEGSVTLTNYESGGHYAGKYIGSVCASADLTSCTANVTLGGNLSSANIGTVCGRIVSGGSLKVDGKQVIYSLGELQAVLNNATSDITLSLHADITGDVKITQKENVNIVIDGNDNTFTGVMTTYGNGRQSGTETLTIKNIKFIAANGATSCIVSPDRSINNAYSYSHNVTVEDCTFTDPDGTVNCAAIRQEDGGDKNWTVKGCTVDNTMHSILQVNNVEGKLTIDDCTVSSKNGANLNSCTNVEMTGCNFDVKGYAVRFGVGSGGNLGTPKTYIITGSTLKSACEDGDAVIMFRASAVDATLTLTETTLDGTTKISGNTTDTTINGTY